jgi:hypothetical protein
VASDLPPNGSPHVQIRRFPASRQTRPGPWDHDSAMPIVETFTAPELGNASFLIADTDKAVAVAIDPFRDIDRYVAWANDHEVRIVRTLP